MKIPIACDTGGTFTDFIFKLDQNFSVLKIPSTPHDPAEAVLTGLQTITNNKPSGRDLIHGMTIAINYLLERKGSETLLLTTDGFRDIIEIGRQNRLHLYKPAIKSRELIPRNMRLEIEERIDSNGHIVTPLNEQKTRLALEEIKKSQNVQSIAICFLFSFLNPEHEIRVKKIAQEIFPGIPVILSYEILPIFREYERTMTTVIDAYISPIVFKYLTNLKQAETYVNSIHLIQSNGGISSIENLQASQSLMSGLTGGVLGAKYSGEVCTEKNIISLDIGGTSTDVALLNNLEILTTSDTKLDDQLPIALPIVDVKTVGAGGGSIAYYDKQHILQVGPQSQGSDPGPACYGRNGDKVCVTDVDLFLGWLNKDNFAGGSLPLYPDKSRKAIQNLSNQQTGDSLTLENLAEGVQKIFHFNVASAIRSVSIEKGYDAREFTLISFGGAGPTHACAIAELLEITKVIIPPYPGCWSAFGLLTADYRYEHSISIVKEYHYCLSHLQYIKDTFSSLEQKGLDKLQKSGLVTIGTTIQRYADIRYKGQSFELRCMYDNSEDLILDRSVFDTIHEQKYGYKIANEELEIVNLGAIVIGQIESIDDNFVLEKPEIQNAIPKRKLFYNDSWVEVNIYTRDQLEPLKNKEGPFVIEQSDSTVIILPGWDCLPLENNHLLLTKKSIQKCEGSK